MWQIRGKSNSAAILSEGESRFSVSGIDFFYRVDIRSCSEIEAQVIFHGCPHDGLKQRHTLVHISRNTLQTENLEPSIWSRLTTFTINDIFLSRNRIEMLNNKDIRF